MADDSKASGLADAMPTDALKDAGQRLLSLLVQKATDVATDRVSDLSERLTGVAENGGKGLKGALTGRDSDDSDDSDDSEDSEDSESSDSDDSDSDGESGGFFSRMKDKVKGVFGAGGKGASGKGGGKGKRLKVTNIIETIDVGLPVRTTYDLWTRFEDFPSFMKKVESVGHESDEKTNWKAQVLWSHRTWQATVLEQVPDSHIVWQSSGAKGHVDGAVTFTGLGPNLTRVLLVLEYWPQGLFEKTGNVWRAQGRRARLEFKHFRRHAMTHTLIHQDEVEGWRGEIRDGEVVKTHEEALEEEEQAAEAEAEDVDTDEGAPDEQGEYDEAEDVEEGDEGPVDEDEDYDDEAADEADDEAEGPVDEDEDYDDESADDEAADEAADDGPDAEADEDEDEDVDDEEPATDGRSRGRRRVAARSGRR